MKKVVVGFLLVLVLGFSTVVAEEVFNDVASDDWFFDNVIVLVDAGIVGGYGDGSFGPEDTMKVDQFIKTMVVALGEDPGNSEGYWAQAYIDEALELNILEVDDFEDYSVMITRADMSKLSVRTVVSLEGNKNYTYSATDNELLLNKISDRSSMSGMDAENYISNSYELGLITGYPDGTFKPNDGLKRSEACTVIRRVIDAGIRQPFVADDWAVRAEEIFEETGYVVFTSDSPITSGQVISEDQLVNQEGKYVFGTYLNYNNSHLDDGHWSIVFSTVAAKKNSDNFKQQMFEAEYILSEIWDVDQTTLTEVLVYLTERVENDGTMATTYWYPYEGAELRIRATYDDSNTLEIAALGFY